MARAMVPAAKIPELQSERLMFSTSDENAMMMQIQAIHAPDGREVKWRPLLRIVEDIFHRVAAAIPGNLAQGMEAQLDVFDDKAFRDASLDLVDRISCEMGCKCTGGGDAHTITMSLLHILASYSWDGKVVLSLAAFAMNYGEFWLVVQLYPSNPLAKSVAFLKQLPDTMEHADILKPKFEAIRNLIQTMLDVTKCVVEFKDLPSQYIPPDSPEMLAATAYIPTAVYWTIRSIVACTSQIMGLKGMDHHENMAVTAEPWELSSLAYKVSNIHSHLMKQLTICHKRIDERRHVETYQTLGRLFEMSHMDNMRILKALIYAKDDLMPLLDCQTKRKVSIEVLKRKTVLLFISDLDLSLEERFIVEQMYQESRNWPTRTESQFEVVWLLVVDRSTAWNNIEQDKFESLRASMPWYSVYHPSLLDPAVIKYIKEVWHFNNKPLLVVLDPQGRVTNTNAMHMIFIWGSMAFPFTTNKEELLWKEETWRIELLIDGIDSRIHTWIREGRHICLYGGEDIEWIRKFTTAARAVALDARIFLEMLYVGKSNPKEKNRKISATIDMENLSHTLPDQTLTWFFWTRLERMWHSKVQQGKSVEMDQIMKEIVRMMSFDGSDQGWALIGKGVGEIAKAKGDTILKSFLDYEKWKENASEKGFTTALNDYISEQQTPHHCTRLILPSTAGSTPNKMVCVECGRSMQKFTMYTCCED